MAGAAGPNTAEAGLVFAYDTGNTITSYIGEPTTNYANTDYLRTIQFHNQGGYNNAGSTADAPERGPGWKKIIITDRGTNFRIAQFPYIIQNYGDTRVYSVEYDFGTTSGYFIYGDGSSGFGVLQDTGTRVTARFTPPSSADWYEALFLGNNTPASGINDTIYYRNYQVESNTHPTPYTPGTRSTTQGLLDLTGNRVINIANVSFDSNAQMTFDGTNDYGQSNVFVPSITSKSYEAVTRLYDVNQQAGGVIGMMGENGEPFDTIVYNETDQGWGFGSTGFERTAWSGVKETTTGFVHLVATYENYSYKLYRNGVLILTTTSYAALNYNFNTVVIFGKRHGTTTGPLNGEIPLAKIYNRVLTANEVATNFQALRYRFGI